MLVVGDFNAKILEPEGYWREKKIAAALASRVLEDISAHFLPHRSSWCRDRRMWSMVQTGRKVRYWTDYILGTDLCLFWNVSVQDPRHNLDHYLILGCLCSALLREHSEYLGRRKRPPLLPPTNPTREDGLFANLQRAVPKPQAWDARKRRVDLGGHVENRR